MIKPVLREISDDKKKLLVFHCPGCGYGHPYEVPRWNWNGDMVRPSFTPLPALQSVFTGTPVPLVRD